MPLPPRKPFVSPFTGQGKSRAAAVAAGFEAGKTGRRIVECPFSEGILMSAWKQGFKEGANLRLGSFANR